VLDTAQAQACISGYALDRPTAQTIANVMISIGASAVKQGTDMAGMVRAGNLAQAWQAIIGLDMATMLIELDQVRAAGPKLLDRLADSALGADVGPGVTGQDLIRIGAAVLTAQDRIQDRWSGYMHQLGVDDQAAIRRYLYQRVLAGDLDTVPRVQHDDPAGTGGDQASTKPTTQASIQYQGNLTGHRVIRTGQTSVDPGNTQITGQVTFMFHEEGDAGLELSVQGSVDFTLSVQGNSKTVEGLTVSNVQAILNNTQVAGQAAWVVPFFSGAIQLEPFVQLVVGINWSSTPSALPPNSLRLSPVEASAMGQVAGGGQAQWAVPGTKVNIFIQGQGSVTAPAGADSTADSQFTVGVGGTF
jgi:hypothetical protein